MLLIRCGRVRRQSVYASAVTFAPLETNAQADEPEMIPAICRCRDGSWLSPQKQSAATAIMAGFSCCRRAFQPRKSGLIYSRSLFRLYAGLYEPAIAVCQRAT